MDVPQRLLEDISAFLLRMSGAYPGVQIVALRELVTASRSITNTKVASKNRLKELCININSIFII